MSNDTSLDAHEERAARRSERHVEGANHDAGQVEPEVQTLYPSELLRETSLSGRGNAPVRNALIQGMQQTQGNRATRSSLAGIHSGNGSGSGTPVQREAPAGVPGVYDPLNPKAAPSSAWAMQPDLQRKLDQLAKWMDENTGDIKKKTQSGRDMLIFFVKSNSAEARTLSNEQVSQMLTEWARRQNVTIPVISVLGQKRQLFYTLPPPPKQAVPRGEGSEGKGELGKDLREFHVSAELGDIGPEGSKCGVAISALAAEGGVKFNPKPEAPVLEAALSAFTLHLRNHCKEIVEAGLGVKGGVSAEGKPEGEAEFQVKVHISTNFTVSIGTSIGAEPHEQGAEPKTDKVPLGKVGGAEIGWNPFNIGTLVELKF